MRIVGYTDRWSVRPEEKIRFMVSCELPSYRADIVRLIHGDENPLGPGFKEVEVPTEIAGEYPGRRQEIRTGSYVIVDGAPALETFCFQAWIYPTTPQKGLQGLLTQWCTDGSGCGLFLQEDGQLGLRLASADGRIEQVRSGMACRAQRWYFVAAGYDRRTSTARIFQKSVTSWPGEDSEKLAEQGTSVRPAAARRLLIAACCATDGASATNHFNGKIASPRLFARALSLNEMIALANGTPPEELGAGLVAAWDFAADAGSRWVRNRCSSELRGLVVNMPARAVTSHSWSGDVVDFRLDPSRYDAIHFHDDDLEDAGWEVDFELSVPASLRSGVYAARLRAGDAEDHVPFFVRPRKGSPGAPILFLAPTNSYLAYGNEHLENLPLEVAPNQKMTPVQPEYAYVLRNRLLSLYDTHSDGSGCCYASRLRPIVNMRPKHYMRLLDCPHQFPADLHLVEWLEAKGYRFDVATDEDLHFDGPDLLAPYRVVLTGTHPEYWSGTMLGSLQRYLESGGRLMYLGGNGFYWITSFDPERPHVIEVRRWGGTRTWQAAAGEYHHSTTGEMGGLWRFRGRLPQKMVGVGYSAEGFDRCAPYQRQSGSFDPRAAFIFDGIDAEEKIGDFPSLVLRYGAAGFELDRADPALGTPDHALVLASSFGHSNAYHHVVEELFATDSRQSGEVSPLVRADLVYFEYPNGGAVFATGSIGWCGALSYRDHDNNVSRITENVLRRFSAPR